MKVCNSIDNRHPHFPNVLVHSDVSKDPQVYHTRA